MYLGDWLLDLFSVLGVFYLIMVLIIGSYLVYSHYKHKGKEKEIEE